MTTDLRMYAVIRQDLGPVPAGKLIAQGGHAYLGSFLSAGRKLAEAYRDDSMHGKIALRARDLEHLAEIQAACRSSGFPHSLVTDAGLTIFKEPTTTCLGIGPITEDQARKSGIRALQLYTDPPRGKAPTREETIRECVAVLERAGQAESVGLLGGLLAGEARRI